MPYFVGLCIWLASLLLATWIGVDRGRWAAGLLFGPLGLIAAGLMLPSLECATERQYVVERAVIERRHREMLEERKRRKARAQMQQ